MKGGRNGIKAKSEEEKREEKHEKWGSFSKRLHLTSRNSENASASGGKPPDPLPSFLLLYYTMEG